MVEYGIGVIAAELVARAESNSWSQKPTETFATIDNVKHICSVTELDYLV